MAELGKIWADDSDTAKIARPLYIEGSQTWYACHHLPLNLSSSFSSEHFTLVSWPCNQISQLGRNPDPVNIHRLLGLCCAAAAVLSVSRHKSNDDKADTKCRRRGGVPPWNLERRCLPTACTCLLSETIAGAAERQHGRHD